MKLAQYQPYRPERGVKRLPCTTFGFAWHGGWQAEVSANIMNVNANVMVLPVSMKNLQNNAVKVRLLGEAPTQEHNPVHENGCFWVEIRPITCGDKGKVGVFVADLVAERILDSPCKGQLESAAGLGYLGTVKCSWQNICSNKCGFVGVGDREVSNPSNDGDGFSETLVKGVRVG